jgi:diketogulonate reductase-like aldo/keto reductase
LDSFLVEQTYIVVDELEAVAAAHESTPARIALAWVQGRPGVTSTIIGARRLAQLEDNVKALDITLSAKERERLDTLTKPTFGFPQSMQPMFPSVHHGGASVNGVYAPTSPFVIDAGQTPY